MTLPRPEVEALFLPAGRVEIPAETARELARVYLAWMDAPKTKVRGKVGELAWVCVSHSLTGKHVRLVVEP